MLLVGMDKRRGRKEKNADRQLINIGQRLASFFFFKRVGGGLFFWKRRKKERKTRATRGMVV